MAAAALQFPFPALDISSLVGAYFEECESPDDNCFLNTRYLPDLLLPQMHAGPQENNDANKLTQKKKITQKSLCVTSQAKIQKMHSAAGPTPETWKYFSGPKNDSRVLFLKRSRLPVTYEMLRGLFHLPVTKAIRELKISLTTFKLTCRKLGIQRWPYRKLKKFAIDEM